MSMELLARESAAAPALEPVSPDLRAGVRLLARLARVAEQACQSSGISLPQYRLLVCIADGPRRASELACAVGVSRPTLTSLVDGLEHAGLLRRVPVASDRRGIRLELTGEGSAAIARAEHALTGRLVRLAGSGARDMLGLLRELVSDLDAALDRERGVANGV